MKTIRFLSVFVIFGMLFSCSAPSASRTYSKEQVLNRTYVGNWEDIVTKQNTWYAARFSEKDGVFYLLDSNGTSEQDAINKLSSSKEYILRFDSSTGNMTLDGQVNPGIENTFPGRRYRIQSETQIDRMAERIEANGDRYYIFEGTMNLYK